MIYKFHYNWESILASIDDARDKESGIVRFHYGRDFHCNPDSFARQLRRRARTRYGKSVSVAVGEDSVIVKVWK